MLMRERDRGMWFNRDHDILHLLPSFINLPSETYRRLGGESFVVDVKGRFFKSKRNREGQSTSGLCIQQS